MAYLVDSQQPTRRFGCGSLILVLLGLATVYSSYRYFTDRSNYENGHQAYSQADCFMAIQSFDKIINSWRMYDLGGFAALAIQERSECQAFNIGVDKLASADPSGALFAYDDFIYNHGESPLVEAARIRIGSIFEKTNAGVLASEGFCDLLDRFQNDGLIPQKNSILPELLYQCGQTYEAVSFFPGAVSMYDQFLKEYPSHGLASDVKDALTRTIVADARASGAGIIPAPQPSGSTSGEATVVIIQNDSPERMRIVFSGPDSRIEELGACSSCQTYTGSGPLYCPELGPIGRYTLQPGQYDVVVQSITDSGVTPWTGNWGLLSGYEYYNCFFVIQSLLP